MERIARREEDQAKPPRLTPSLLLDLFSQFFLVLLAFSAAAFLLALAQTGPFSAVVSFNDKKHLMIPFLGSTSQGDWRAATSVPAVLLTLQVAEVLRWLLGRHRWGLLGLVVPAAAWCWIGELALAFLRGGHDCGEAGGMRWEEISPRYASLVLVAGFLVVLIRRVRGMADPGRVDGGFRSAGGLGIGPLKCQLFLSLALIAAAAVLPYVVRAAGLFEGTTRVWEAPPWFPLFVILTGLFSVLYAALDRAWQRRTVGVPGIVGWLRGGTVLVAFGGAAEMPGGRTIEVATLVVRSWIGDWLGLFMTQPFLIVLVAAGVAFVCAAGHRVPVRSGPLPAILLCAVCGAGPWFYIGLREPHGSLKEEGFRFFFLPILDGVEAVDGGLRSMVELSREEKSKQSENDALATPVAALFCRGLVVDDTRWGAWQLFGDAIPRYLLAWVTRKQAYALREDGTCGDIAVFRVEIAGAMKGDYGNWRGTEERQVTGAVKSFWDNQWSCANLMIPLAGPADLVAHWGIEVTAMSDEQPVVEVVVRRPWRKEIFLVEIIRQRAGPQ